MILLLVLALLAIVVFGVVFTAHWLFIIAAILVFVWLLTFFFSGRHGRKPHRLAGAARVALRGRREAINRSSIERGEIVSGAIDEARLVRSVPRAS